MSKSLFLTYLPGKIQKTTNRITTKKLLKTHKSGYLRANTIMKDLLRSVIQEDLLNTSGIQARKMNESFEFAIWEIGSRAQALSGSKKIIHRLWFSSLMKSNQVESFFAMIRIRENLYSAH